MFLSISSFENDKMFSQGHSNRMPHRDKILLQTKLYQPPITRGLIDRPRLFEQFSSSIGHPLTLICAPAGYGKTTLVCSWLEHMAAGRRGSRWMKMRAISTSSCATSSPHCVRFLWTPAVRP